MKPVQLKTFECPSCGEHNSVDDFETITEWQCTECDQLHEDKEDAQECCKEG